MESIDIAYSVTIEGLQFNEIDFSDTTPEFKNIRLKPIDSNSDEYHILIKKNITSAHPNQLKPVFTESTLESEKFVYIFSSAADVKIFNFECIGYFKEDKLFPLKQVFSDGIKVTVSAKLTVIAGEPSVQKIKEKMKADYDLPSLQMFYDSATVKEPIGRFISLYTLLLHYCSNNQNSVDQAILSVDPTISQFRSPHNKGYETIFTKLRNELSHKRENVNILKTHDEIRLNIDRFEQIVKNYIFKKP